MQAFPPREHVAGGRTMTVELGGRDRFKFFCRPMVPGIESGTQTTITAVRPTIHRALQPDFEKGLSTASRPPRRLDALGTSVGKSSFSGSKLPPFPPATGGAAKSEAKVATGPTAEIAVQTDYRENDCQTDPYTPDYFIEEKEQPEVLAIMELKWGEGLPAALAEVEMIDRVQRRKKVESELPQGNDNASMQIRLEALEALERTEWDEREAHIRHLQDARLQHVQGALQKREEKREEQSRLRTERFRQNKLAGVEQQLRRIQEKRLTITRKLTAKHTNPCQEKEIRDIIQSHVLYGPKGRQLQTSNLVENISTTNYDVRPTLLSFSEGVQELEKTKAPRITKLRLNDLQPTPEPAVQMLETNYQKRLARNVVSDLEYANEVIEKSHQTKEKAASIQDLYRATPRLVRPDTPTLVLRGDEDEEREEAMILLQRLLRGRAVQNDFYEGKERCNGLILELQLATKAKDEELTWIPEKQREQFQARQEAMVQSVVDGVAGDVVFGTLDYLYKELTRQIEAAKVDQLRVHAESTRQQREEEEAERRRQELWVRRREDEQYKSLVESVDSTLESFLNQLLTRAVQTTASRQAIHEELQRRSEVKEPPSEVSKEEFVCQLLDAFVIPQVCHVVTSKEHEKEKALAEVATSTADSMSTTVTTEPR